MDIEMNLKIRTPEDTPTMANLNKPNSTKVGSGTVSYADFTSTSVREKLSTTRHLLEQTLHKKRRLSGAVHEDEEVHNTHHQLKKPAFEELSQIYTNYQKVPTTKKLEYKVISPHRSSSAPPVFQKTREQLVQEREEKLKQECTFKPAINKIPQSKNLDYSEKKFDRNEWFKNLTKPKTEVLEHRERLKREKEEEDSRNCSFRPSISSFRSASSGRPRIEERLYTSENKAAKREQLKREKDEREAASFPFSPQVAESVSILVDDRKLKGPLYKRVHEVQQEKTQLRLMEREKQEKAENHTFQPYISPKSNLLASQKCLGSVVDRLSRDTSNCKDRMSETSNTSMSFVSTSTKTFNAKEFLDRQQEFLEKSKREKEELATKSTTDLKFKPIINQNSNLIAFYKHNYSQETLEDKLQRIGKEAQMKKNQIQEKLNQEHYSKYRFEPELNPLSRQLAKNSTMESYSEESRNKKKLQAQASVAQLEKLCSFNPRINSPKRFAGINSHYKQGEDILRGIKNTQGEKRKMALSVRKEHEMEELSRCTFKPKSISRVRSDSNIIVKGTDRFLELRNMAKKQLIEKDLREKQVLYKDMSRNLLYSNYY